MADKYCSTCFKTGEELDAALMKALECNDNAERAEAARTAAEEAAARAEEAAERTEQGGGSGDVAELTERVEALEGQAEQLPTVLTALENKVTACETTAGLAFETAGKAALRLNALEANTTSVDMSAFDASGVIVETLENGVVVTYTMTFDENGNPTTITEVRSNAPDTTYVTTLTW
jgi:predicted RNase H-like nuclease (RuvC/YqgF family)